MNRIDNLNVYLTKEKKSLYYDTATKKKYQHIFSW